MHEEDERPPNEKSHAYHFSITYNGCEFCGLIPPAILVLPKCLFKAPISVNAPVSVNVDNNGRYRSITAPLV